VKLRSSWIACLGLLLAPLVGHAEPAPARGSLHWSRASTAGGCIDEAALAAEVERLLERPVFVPREAADLHVEGHVEGAPAKGWRATLALSSGDGVELGHRELHSSSASCRDLDESLALAIALMIDPEGVLTPSIPKPGPAAPPEVGEPALAVSGLPIPGGPAAMDPDQVPSASAKGAHPRPWRGEAEAEATVAFGLLPGVGSGLATRLLVTPPSFWGIELEGTFWRDSGAQSSSSSAFGSNIGLVQGGMLLCPLELRQKRLSALACAGLQVGRMSAAGFGFDPNYSESSWLVDTAAQARARLRIVGPVAALLGASMGVALNPYRFVYRDPTGGTLGVFRVAPVFASLDFGLSAEWP
jgi:hypothetical protein